MSQSPDTMRYVDLISPHIYCGGSAPKDAAPGFWRITA